MQKNNLNNEAQRTHKKSSRKKPRRKGKKKNKKKTQNYMHSMIELNSFQEPSFEVNSKIYNSKYVR